MKKILIMNDLLYGGGVEKMMMDLVNNISSKNYDITILTPNKDRFNRKYYRNDIKFMSIQGYLFKENNMFFRACNKILKKINRFICISKLNYSNFDVAIAIKEGRIMKFISQIKAKKSLAWIHTDYEVFHWTKNSFGIGNKFGELECMKKFDKVVCVSESTKKSVIKIVGNPQNLCVKYNPINEIEIEKKSKEYIVEKRSSGKTLFVTVGRLTSQKGYKRLLNTCIELNKEQYNYELWIIGSGEEELELRKIIEENNLNNIKLLGLQENPYKYMKEADWFICSSIWESFGIAIQESIILGVPVITTNCPGACELLDTSVNSIIVENSQDGILKGMKKALNNSDLLKFYKGKIKYLSEDFKLEKRIKRIEELF
ncbi:glycosyltransferase [Clostridium beijerinckii]|uniref:glycosyltransferase n=1 Tax=Clostridium beijerinckii TaxID=1520 RepID=UPI0022E052E9|nr:glycosyltransferase [Clostridium beijerinckii]